VDTPSGWTFLSNHTHVLLCIAQQPDARLRDVALRVGITERAVQKIVGELEDAGALTRLREGRRNLYVIHPECPLRHAIEQHQTISKLLALVLSPAQLRNLQRRNRALELATGS
jgi:predicted transcriptional regulator